LPHNRWGHWLSGGSVPDNGGFPLIRNSNASQLPSVDTSRHNGFLAYS
jgi:hypothetical protein